MRWLMFCGFKCLFSHLFSPEYLKIASAIYAPRFTGTALPIICSIFVLVPSKSKSSGKVCIILRSLDVSGLMPSNEFTGSPG